LLNNFLLSAQNCEFSALRLEALLYLWLVKKPQLSTGNLNQFSIDFTYAVCYVQHVLCERKLRVRTYWSSSMRKKLFLLLVAVLVIALLTVVPIIVKSQLDASSARRERNAFSGIQDQQPSRTPTLSETSTNRAGIMTGGVNASTAIPSPTRPTSISTPIPTPPSLLHQGQSTLFLKGQYDSVNPVYYGTTIWIDGTAFQPGEQVTVYWNYQQPGQTVVTTITAKSDGSFQYETPAPGTPNLGKVNVAAIGMTSHLLAITATTEPADVIPNPLSAMIGSTVQVIGGGYDSNESVTILLRGNVVATVTTNSLGSFSTSFTVSNSAGPGAASLQAIGKTSGLHISASAFGISLPITISPTSGPSGAQVTITGSHFTPSGQISINWEAFSGPGSNYTLTTITASPTGSFSVTVTAPFCESQQNGTTCEFDAFDSQTKYDAAVPFPET
jgi:hypothetical protein